jgi:DNA polymerase-3 subunit epsilon
MLRIEIFRDGGSEVDADKWKKSPAFCTCNSAKPIVNLPPTPRMVAKGMTTPKPPNLGEAYKHFTGKTLEGAHNAAVDVMACKAVYFAIREQQRKAA